MRIKGARGWVPSVFLAPLEVDGGGGGGRYGGGGFSSVSSLSGGGGGGGSGSSGSAAAGHSESMQQQQQQQQHETVGAYSDDGDYVEDSSSDDDPDFTSVQAPVLQGAAVLYSRSRVPTFAASDAPARPALATNPHHSIGGGGAAEGGAADGNDHDGSGEGDYAICDPLPEDNVVNNQEGEGEESAYADMPGDGSDDAIAGGDGGGRFESAEEESAYAVLPNEGDEEEIGVEQILADIGLSVVWPMLLAEDINDIETLADMTKADFKEMGITLGKASKIMRAVKNVQEM